MFYRIYWTSWHQLYNSWYGGIYGIYCAESSPRSFLREDKSQRHQKSVTSLHLLSYRQSHVCISNVSLSSTNLDLNFFYLHSSLHAVLYLPRNAGKCERWPASKQCTLIVVFAANAEMINFLEGRRELQRMQQGLRKRFGCSLYMRRLFWAILFIDRIQWNFTEIWKHSRYLINICKITRSILCSTRIVKCVFLVKYFPALLTTMMTINHNDKDDHNNNNKNRICVWDIENICWRYKKYLFEIFWNQNDSPQALAHYTTSPASLGPKVTFDNLNLKANI